MSSIRPMVALDLLNFAPVNLDPLTETYNIGFYLEYLAKWPQMCHVIVSRTDEIEGYILGKVEASSGYQQPTALPYSPDTNENMNYLPWHAHITALTVAPDARRQGHARKLTELFEDQSDVENGWFVDLFVRADNRNAIALYKSMGYSVFRRVVEYYNDGTDAFDMRKPLKRDVDHKHVRENGEGHAVDPSEVWVLESIETRNSLRDLVKNLKEEEAKAQESIVSSSWTYAAEVKDFIGEHWDWLPPSFCSAFDRALAGKRVSPGIMGPYGSLDDPTATMKREASRKAGDSGAEECAK